MDSTKFKAFAEDKSNITRMIISVFDTQESIGEKGSSMGRCTCYSDIIEIMWYIANYVVYRINFFPDSSKLKEFADDNFEFDENGRKFSK